MGSVTVVIFTNHTPIGPSNMGIWWVKERETMVYASIYMWDIAFKK
jgi:hypothetical protein